MVRKVKQLDNSKNTYRISKLSLISGIALWFFYIIILVFINDSKKILNNIDGAIYVIAVVGAALMCLLLHVTESSIPYLTHVKNVDQVIRHLDRIKKWSPKLTLNLQEWRTWNETVTETETSYIDGNSGGGSVYSGPVNEGGGSSTTSTTSVIVHSGWCHVESLKFPVTKCENDISGASLEDIRNDKQANPIQLDIDIEFGDRNTEIVYDQLHNYLDGLLNGETRIVRSGCKPKWLWSHILCVNNWYSRILLNRFVHSLIILFGFGWFYSQWFYKNYYSKAQANQINVTKVLYSDVDNDTFDLHKTRFKRRLLFHKYLEPLLMFMLFLVLMFMESFNQLLIAVGIYYIFMIIIEPLLIRYLPYFKD